jgi:predicted ester cyclase
VTSSAEEQQGQKNKEVVHQFFEAFDRHDIEKMEQLVSSTNYSLHFPTMPLLDWNGHKQVIGSIIKGLPDIHHDFELMITEGDKVATRMRITATHKGELQGIPPTGKKVSISASDFVTIIDGRLVEHWVDTDLLGLMQQIGAIPSASSSSSSSST